MPRVWGAVLLLEQGRGFEGRQGLAGVHDAASYLRVLPGFNLLLGSIPASRGDSTRSRPSPTSRCFHRLRSSCWTTSRPCCRSATRSRLARVRRSRSRPRPHPLSTHRFSQHRRDPAGPPRVHANGAIDLEVEQEISNVANSTGPTTDADDLAAPDQVDDLGHERADGPPRRA